MASSVARLTVPLSTAAVSVARPARRRITSDAGHALEKLSHAIEYLTDEMVHRGGSLDAHTHDLEAVHLLMSLNRSVYYDCPVIPSVGDRFWALLQSFGV